MTPYEQRRILDAVEEVDKEYRELASNRDKWFACAISLALLVGLENGVLIFYLWR